MLFLTIRIFSNLMVVRCKVFSRNAERERERPQGHVLNRILRITCIQSRVTRMVRI